MCALVTGVQTCPLPISTGSIRGTTTVNVVASGKPIPPATQQRLSELNGAVDAIWARIEIALGMMDPSANLKAKVDATKKAFFTDLTGIYAQIRAASDKGEAYPFSMADFRAKQNPLLYNAGYMRDAAIDDALMVADRLVSVRSRQLMIESGITIVAIILLIGGDRKSTRLNSSH